jgi:hypothetical protein
MKKSLIPILVLIAVLCLGGAAYAKKHSDDVQYAQAVATVKTKNKRLKTAYENKLTQWEVEHDGWEDQKATYKKCKSLTAGTFAAMDKFAGVISGGTNYEGHSDALEDVSTAISGLSRDFDADCMTITLALDRADTHYNKAGSMWMDWYNDLDDPRTLEDLPLERQWRKGDDAVSDATAALSDMKDDVGYEPEKPVEPKYAAIPKK